MRQQKIRFTVWLEPAVFDAAKARAQRGGLSVSVVLAQAARESLLEAYRSDRDAELLKAVERVFHKLRRIEERHGLDHRVLQEMLGLAVLSFFNHTPAVPEDQKKAALLSGKVRFERYLDLLAKNIRGGSSVLGEVSRPEPHSDVAAEPEPPGDAGQMHPTDTAPPAKESPHSTNTPQDRGLFDPMLDDPAFHESN